MALAAQVETLENIPEALHEHYKQNAEGKFVLDADVEAHPQVQGLRNAYKEDHAKIQTLKGQMERFKDIDPDRWTLLKDLKDEDLAALETWRNEQARKVSNGNGNGKEPDFEAEFQKRIQPMKTAHEREIEKREQLLAASKADNDRLNARMRQARVEQAIIQACAEAGVLSGAVEEIVLLGQQYFKINDTQDVVAVDRAGVEIFGTDGKPMRPREWVISRGPEKAHWFPLNNGGGAGGGRFAGDARISRRSDLKDLKQKVAFISKHGQKAFEDLPD